MKKKILINLFIFFISFFLFSNYVFAYSNQNPVTQPTFSGFYNSGFLPRSNDTRLTDPNYYNDIFNYIVYYYNLNIDISEYPYMYTWLSKQYVNGYSSSGRFYFSQSDFTNYQNYGPSTQGEVFVLDFTYGNNSSNSISLSHYVNFSSNQYMPTSAWDKDYYKGFISSNSSYVRNNTTTFIPTQVDLSSLFKNFYNYFYLNNTLVDQNGCSLDELNSELWFSCPYSSDTSISANKVVSIIHLDTTYLPSEWWYNNLGWSNTTDRYYNSLINGDFPLNSNLTQISFYNYNNRSIVYNTEILDVQYNNYIYSPISSNSWNLFSTAFRFSPSDINLTGYNSLYVVLEFPTTDIKNFNVWSGGFNNLSSNYIQENINIASKEIQQELLDNLNGNTVSVDNFTLFFQNFSLNNHGLTNFITLPLSFLQSMSNSSCSSISLPLPFSSQPLVLPCLSTIYNQYIQPLYILITLVIRGVVYYSVALDCFKFVKKLHSPDSSSVEVIDL